MHALHQQQRRFHRSGTWALPWAFFAALIVTVYLFWPTKDTLDEAFFKRILESQEPFKPDLLEGRWKYCDVHDIVHGRWESKRDFKDMKSILDAYQLKVSPISWQILNRAGEERMTDDESPSRQDGADTKCLPLAVADSADEKPKDKEDRAFERIKTVAVPSLRSVGGCRMLEMNRRTMLKRLLRSPSGLT
jgi:hypothetical protein